MNGASTSKQLQTFFSGNEGLFGAETRKGAGSELGKEMAGAQHCVALFQPRGNLKQGDLLELSQFTGGTSMVLMMKRIKDRGNQAITVGAGTGELTLKTVQSKGVVPKSESEASMACYRLGRWATASPPLGLGLWSIEDEAAHMRYWRNIIEPLFASYKFSAVLDYDSYKRSAHFHNKESWDAVGAVYMQMLSAAQLKTAAEQGGSSTKAGVKTSRRSRKGLIMVHAFDLNSNAICRKYQDGDCKAPTAAPCQFSHVCHRCRVEACTCSSKVGKVGASASAKEQAVT